MPIITDPNIITRDEIVYNPKPNPNVEPSPAEGIETISIYPVGDTERTGGSYVDCFVATNGTITRGDGTNWSTNSVAAGDVAVLYNDLNCGHYYINGTSTTTATLTDIDAGTAGAATTNLNPQQKTIADASTDVAANVITISGHGYVTGDAVVYRDGGGGTIGLTDGTTYFIIRLTTNTFSVASSYANAVAGTVVSVSAGTGVAHTFDKRILVKVFTNGANTDEVLTYIGTADISTAGDGTGDIADGISLQAAYSHGKDEWFLDTLANAGAYNDDLIRYQFPYEAITSEQFEIGGGAAHGGWNFFNEYTRKKVKTGGFTHLQEDVSSNDIRLDTGIVTLGSLDADTQVYFQSSNTGDAGRLKKAPENFSFKGPINEPLQVYLDENGDTAETGNDFFNKTFLRLFARKKAKSYVRSTIEDIGVTTVQNIVNRFPLSHTDDSAITAKDAEILGKTPWRQTFVNSSVGTPTDGVTTSTGTAQQLTRAGETFQTKGVVAGDTLEITAATTGTLVGYYTIASVDSETQLTIASDADFSTWTSEESGVTFQIRSYYRLATKSGGTVADVTTGQIRQKGGADLTVGELADSTEDLSTASPGDFVHITAGDDIGIYRVLGTADGETDPAANLLYFETVDYNGDGLPTSLTAANYKILTPGMYLQYKKESITLLSSGSVSSFAFDNAAKTITLSGTSPVLSSSIGAGTILEISGSENTGENDGSFTVLERTSDTVITLVSTDTLVTNADDTTATVTTFDSFIRTVGTTSYGFNWRVNANVEGGTDAGLAQVFQFIQHQLRQNGTANVGAGAGEIDFAEGNFRGDITDLLMAFATPTGTTLNMFIDSLNTDDLNNITLQDHSGVNRSNPFIASGSLTFNTNLAESGETAKYRLFFTNDDAGDNLGRDYGTEYAITVKDKDGVDIAGTVPTEAQAGAGSSVNFSFAYDDNVQRGSASAGQDAPVTLVAIGLSKGQFVKTLSTIGRSTGQTISAVAALERNYIA